VIPTEKAVICKSFVCYVHILFVYVLTAYGCNQEIYIYIPWLYSRNIYIFLGCT